MESCLNCLHCKNPKWTLFCSEGHWLHENFTIEKFVTLIPKEQKKRNFNDRKLFEQAHICYDYNEMD